MNEYYVYGHYLDGQLKYVGSGKGRRFKAKNQRSTKHLELWDNLDKTILFSNLSRKEAWDIEQRLISENFNSLLNICRTVNRVKPLNYEYLVTKIQIDSSSKSGISNLKGKPVGYLRRNGYYCVLIDRQEYLVHRVVMCLVIKEDIPIEKEVDHIDRNKSNNSPENLRVVSKSENNLNRKIQGNNTSGFTGIHFNERDSAWIVNVITPTGNLVKYFTVSRKLNDSDYNIQKQKSLDLAIEFRKQVRSIVPT